MLLQGNTCLLCWYAYLAPMYFLWGSPKMLKHGWELTDQATIFFGVVLGQKETV